MVNEILRQQCLVSRPVCVRAKEGVNKKITFLSEKKTQINANYAEKER